MAAETFSNDAPELNLVIAQGATFQLPLTWKDANGNAINNTGGSAAMKFRSSADATTVLYDASANIVLGGANGAITVTVPTATTAGFTWPGDRAVYDLEITLAGVVTRLLRGTAVLSREVTR